MCKKQDAAIWLNKTMKEIPVISSGADTDTNFFEYVQGLIAKHGKHEWAVCVLNMDEKSKDGLFIPLTFHFMGGGMFIRNHMRDGGYGEEYFEIENIDDVYIDIIETAVELG